MSITAKEIARLAGVSRGTVDRALKNRPGISRETKMRILEIAERYDYKPNIIGKALVYSGKPIKISVILNSIGNPFFDDVKAGVFAAQEEFESYGFEIKLYEFKGYDAENLLDLLDEAVNDSEYIILTPICDSRVEEKIRSLQENSKKIIMLSSVLEGVDNAVYVGCDYLKSGRIAGRLTGLISGGRANLYIITGSSNHKGHAQRVEGIKAVTEKSYPSINLLGVSESNDDDETAYYEMKNAFEKYPQIDFVYITAGGVNGTLKAVREQKHNVRVCTFDDTEITRRALLSGDVLATICQQPFEQGYYSVKAIFDRIIMKKEVQSVIYTQLSIKVDEAL
ncbi:LacI family DNA-binding transcriptional regulator [Eubacterium sp.]|uniref:LacI family DNA-binding transcriptional regulator n=1 Tax=Eubacterium sp. TaxID=142586 RepID=UPI003EFDB5EF